MNMKTKNNMQKIIISIMFLICIILIAILVILNYKNYNKEKEKQDLQEKILSEIDFVSTSTIDAMNKLNNISVVRYKIYTQTLNTNNNSSSKGAKQQTLEKNEIANEGESTEKGNTSSSVKSSNLNNSTEPSNGNSGETSSESDKVATNKGSASSDSLSSNDNINPSEMKTNNSLLEVAGGDIDWDNIEYIYENIFTSIPIMALDLEKKNVDSNLISNLNIALNGIAQSIIGQDKNSCIINYYNLYAYLNEIVKDVVEDDYTVNYYGTITNVLNAYALANQENKFKEMEESINKAINQFANILKDDSIEYNKKQNIKKIDLELKHTKDSIKLSDKNIFYLQYKNVMQDLITL